MAKMIVVNEQWCLACRACELACALAHSDVGSLAEAVAAAAPLKPRVHVQSLPPAEGPAPETALVAASMPLQCRHCEDAPCMMVCPSGAIYRPDDSGPVLVDPQRCIGCKFCLMACPFGVMDLSPDGRAAMKCDQCVDRTAEGLEPACVAACPTGAIRYVELDDYLRQRRREAAGVLTRARARADENTER